MLRYRIRNAVSQDLDGLQRLAKILNTINLPDESSALLEVLIRSQSSFYGEVANPAEREYVFVLEDLASGQIIGSSQVIAQHGTRDAPHIFFEVNVSERYSKTIDRHFKHQVLRLGYNYEGPTEIGGLVVDPEYRKTKEGLGRQLSLVRFLFIGMNRPLFRSRVLAELLPPLLPNGKSLLWEALGRRFTGLDYVEADHISRTNKEFIEGLFPEDQIYSCMFSDEVKAIIGEVGKGSLPAKRLLESIGFRYQNRIDPFDGGPHYEAECNEVDPIVNSFSALITRSRKSLRNPSQWLVATLQNEFSKAAKFRAGVVDAEFASDGTLVCAGDDLMALELLDGARVWAYRVE